MTPHSERCTACGAHFFPRRMRCHRCGGMAFDKVPFAGGQVVTVTRVHRAPEGWPHAHLVEVEAGELRILAVSEHAPAIGGPVALREDETGAIFVVSNT